MPPDSLEHRVSLLERDFARNDQRLADLASRVDELAPLLIRATELRGSIVGIERRLTGLEESVGKIDETLDTRDRVATAERAATRRALIALTGAIGAAVVTALGGIIAVLIGAG